MVEALVAAANDAGGKDNVTAVYAEGPRLRRAVGGDRVNALTPTEPPIRQGPPARAVLPATERCRRRSAVRSSTAARPGSCSALLLGDRRRARADVLRGADPGASAADAVVSPADGAPFATIAAAMAVARPGDVVRVEPGDYAEQVTLPTASTSSRERPARSRSAVRPASEPAVAGLLAGGTPAGADLGPADHLAMPAARPTPAISIAGPGVTLELVEISGPFARAIAVEPDVVRSPSKAAG